MQSMRSSLIPSQTTRAGIRLMIAVGAVLLGLGLPTALARVAFGHDWYPASCCSGQDCREALPGEVVERDGGFCVASSGRCYPYQAPEVHYESPDGQYHLCQFTTSAGAFGESQPQIIDRCIFVPPGGV